VLRKFKLGNVAAMGLMVVGIAVIPVESASATAIEAELPHCAVEIFPVGQEASSEAECFATEAEVEAFLAGPPASESGGRAAAASVAVGTVYKDAGGTGGSLTFWGSSGCSAATFGFPTVPSGWDNAISSVRATNDCWATVYADASYGGSRLNCTPYCASIGARNDSVKSLVFRPTGTLG